MAKSKAEYQEVNIIWDFITCAALYAAICYFNGPDKQQELDQESVRKFALIISVVWFFISIVILRFQGIKVVVFSSKKKKAEKAINKVKEKVVSAGAKAAETYILKDPKTGAETLYIKDDNTGQWVSEDGNTILNTDKIADWKRQRMDDAKWQKEVNEKIKQPTRFEDIDRQQELEEQKIIHESYVEKIGAKYGKYGEDEDTIYDAVSNKVGRNEVEYNHQMDRDRNLQVGQEIAENLSETADVSVDVLSAMTGPTGKKIKNIYDATKTYAGDLTDAYVNDKDMLEATATATAKAGTNYVQNNIKGGGKKAAANIIGDSALGGLDAYQKGENVGVGMGIGALKGTGKTIVDKAMDAAGNRMKQGIVNNHMNNNSITDIINTSSSEHAKNVVKNVKAIDGITTDIGDSIKGAIDNEIKNAGKKK